MPACNEPMSFKNYLNESLLHLTSSLSVADIIALYSLAMSTYIADIRFVLGRSTTVPGTEAEAPATEADPAAPPGMEAEAPAMEADPAAPPGTETEATT